MHPRIKHIHSFLTKKDYKKTYLEKERIKKIPRFTEFSTVLTGKQLIIPDSASFLFMYREIFEREIYKFRSEREDPIILDAGANIGLSVLYFKQIYPKAHITAFEPDKNLFKTLQHNVWESYKYQDVTLVEKAVWNEETTLSFSSEGADAGRIDMGLNNYTTYEVDTTRLKDYLGQPVDFMKIDIEGAETEVLLDSEALLGNVDKIFVEYHSFTNQDQKLDQLIQVLSKNKFRLYINEFGFGTTCPFVETKSYNGMDLQLNIFASKIK